MWLTTEEENCVIVEPINDVKSHDRFGLDCPCGVKVDNPYADKKVILVHNAFDGRQVLEAMFNPEQDDE